MRVLFCQEYFVPDSLLSVAILVEGHDYDAVLLGEADLNVDPFEQRQENGI